MGIFVFILDTGHMTEHAFYIYYFYGCTMQTASWKYHTFFTLMNGALRNMADRHSDLIHDEIGSLASSMSNDFMSSGFKSTNENEYDPAIIAKNLKYYFKTPLPEKFGRYLL